MMQNEMKGLMNQNRMLKEGSISQESSQKVQGLLREREDLVETLRQREQAITKLRIEND